MRTLLAASVFAIAACSENQSDQEPDPLEYSKADSIEYENIVRSKRELLAKTFVVKKILDSEIGCNRIRANYLVKANTENEDTILQAMKIFTDSVFMAIPYKEGCSPVKCIVAIYDNMKDYPERKWLALGSRLMGNEAKVQYSYYR